MANLRERMDGRFEKLGRLLFRNPVKALVLVLATVAVLGSQVTKLRMDTSFEALLHESDPSRLEYDAFRDQFGRDELVVLAIGSENVFAADFLERLQAIHRDLEEEVPYVERVHSLVNARHTRAEEDALFVENLMDDWSEGDSDLSEFERQIRGNPLYLNNLISLDGHFATIIIETKASTGAGSPEQAHPVDAHYLSAEENQEIVEAVNAVADRYRAPGTVIAVGGTPVASHAFFLATIQDAAFTSVLVLLTITLFLALLFRRVSGIALPWFVVLGALACTCGLMGVLGVPLKLTTTILPSFLFAVGVGDSVHLLSMFYRRIETGSNKEDATAHAMGHSGVPILMTSLTTAVGLLSFSLADLAAIAELGIFTAFGCMMAFLLTIFMLPPFLALVPIKPKAGVARQGKPEVMDRILISFAEFSSRHPMKIMITCILVFVLCMGYMMRLRFSHDTMSWLPERMAIKQDSLLIDQILQGSITLEVIVDTEQENGLHEPAILNRIESVAEDIGRIETDDLRVGKILSINDIVKEIHKALNNNDSAYYTIPQDRKKIAQELLLFEMSDSDDLARLVNDRFSKTRVTIRTPWIDAVVYEDFIREVSDRFRDAFQGRAEIHSTGAMALLARTISATMSSMVESYVIAIVVITILMILVVANVRIGLLSMLPNLLPIFLVMGFMAAARIPMDVCSIMIGSVAIGLVVDDTVHFLYNFQRYFRRTGNESEAVRLTLLTAGRAMLITSLILSAAFFVVVFASLKHTARFGYLTGMVILLALLADFVFAPALMILIARGRRQLLE